MNAFFLLSTAPKRLTSITIWLRLLLLAPLWANLPTSFATPIVYNVAVDTSVVQGSDGYVDFQFNVNGPSSLNASVEISNFISDATLDSTSQADGGGSGVLPGQLTIANSDSFNAILQGLTFGNFLGFDLSISGPAVDNPVTGSDTSSFSLSLLDNGFLPLLTTDVRGSILTIDILDNGDATVTTFDANAFGSPSVVTVTNAGNSVATPSVPTLLFPAVLAMLLLRHGHRSTSVIASLSNHKG